MKITASPLGPFETNAYLVVAENGKDCCVIDAPKDAGPLLLAEIKRQGLNLTHLLITHGHWDHMCDGHHFAAAGARSSRTRPTSSSSRTSKPAATATSR